MILVNLSGRGDKDVDTAIKWFGLDTTGTGSETVSRSAPSAAPERRRLRSAACNRSRAEL